MTATELLTRRVISPAKLKAAREAAGWRNITALAKKLCIDRTAYMRWEDEKAPALSYADFVGMQNALILFGVKYEDVSDPVEAVMEPAQQQPAQASI